METLSIKQEDRLIIPNLIRIGDLIYFDGPVLTVFEDIFTNHLFVFDWVDHDDNNNRWLIYRVTAKSLLDFIKKVKSHYELYKASCNYPKYIIDIERGKIFSDYTVLKELVDVPNTYLPNKDVYFDIIDSRNIEKIKTLVMKNLSQEKQINEYFQVIHKTYYLNVIQLTSSENVFIASQKQYIYRLLNSSLHYDLHYTKGIVINEIGHNLKSNIQKSTSSIYPLNKVLCMN